MIEETVQQVFRQRHLNESLNDEKVQVEQILSQINPKTFAKQCQGKTNIETAEYLYRMYLDKIDYKTLLELLKRDEKVIGLIRNLGGYPLMYCLSMYCEKIQNNKEKK